MQITIREPGSAITHYIAMMLALVAAAPLLVKAVLSDIPFAIIAMGIYITAMILLYMASALYHSVNVGGKILKIFKKFDHMMIYGLIAGSYTPICMLVLDRETGGFLLFLVWAIAIVGMLITAFWVNCPKWLSSIVYIAMGWVCLLVFPMLLDRLSTGAFWWLLAGGILYTIGGVIYALKLKAFNSLHKYFGSHEIFHVFVMAGSFCHFIVMYCYVI